jgi:hypothetical protein
MVDGTEIERGQDEGGVDGELRTRTANMQRSTGEVNISVDVCPLRV